VFLLKARAATVPNVGTVVAVVSWDQQNITVKLREESVRAAGADD
jgi:hypothetical protein